MPYKGETIEGQDAILDHVKQNLQLLGDIKSEALLATVKIEYEYSTPDHKFPRRVLTVARFIDENGTIVARKERKHEVSMRRHWDDEDDRCEKPGWDEYGYGG